MKVEVHRESALPTGCENSLEEVLPHSRPSWTRIHERIGPQGRRERVMDGWARGELLGNFRGAVIRHK